MSDQQFWGGIRQALLHVVDAVEKRWFPTKPTTADIRKWYKDNAKPVRS